MLIRLHIETDAEERRSWRDHNRWCGSNDSFGRALATLAASFELGVVLRDSESPEGRPVVKCHETRKMVCQFGIRRKCGVNLRRVRVDSVDLKTRSIILRHPGAAHKQINDSVI